MNHLIGQVVGWDAYEVFYHPEGFWLQDILLALLGASIAFPFARWSHGIVPGWIGLSVPLAIFLLFLGLHYEQWLFYVFILPLAAAAFGFLSTLALVSEKDLLDRRIMAGITLLLFVTILFGFYVRLDPYHFKVCAWGAILVGPILWGLWVHDRGYIRRPPSNNSEVT
jgi:hypothetical protein